MKRNKKDAPSASTGHRVISLAGDKGAAFWQLRARVADVQRAEQNAQAALACVERARAALGQQLAVLGAEHGFNPAAMRFELNDDALTLTVTPEATATT